MSCGVLERAAGSRVNVSAKRDHMGPLEDPTAKRLRPGRDADKRGPAGRSTGFQPVDGFRSRE